MFKSRRVSRSGFKQKALGQDLEGEQGLSERRRSRESSTPLRIAHRPLSQAQDFIIKMAGGEEKELLVEGCKEKHERKEKS